ncbi:MAG TPA: RNA polymerase sigma-70 factor [Steroidobacteraceae bacterium]|nr:RNA polymerase sigma-70 factor [Steroidobacteraceae bacterium]
MDPASAFERHRPKLFGIAYRMLGSRADAEDVLQEAYLRWHRASTDEIRSCEAWLVTATTRLCIDRLRASREAREIYVGPWLPEPLIGEAAPAADTSVELASSLSIAFLVVLERLAPDERAAFLLHEVFDTGYAEIAQMLGKSEVACRQIVSRARRRVRENRPRVQVSEAAKRALLDRFVQAVQTQDKEALLKLFAESATWISDGGGKTVAARKVIRGRERIVRFVLGVLGSDAKRFGRERLFLPVTVNDEPGLAVHFDGRLYSVISVRTDGERILDVFIVLNPDKLPPQADPSP